MKSIDIYMSWSEHSSRTAILETNIYFEETTYLVLAIITYLAFILVGEQKFPHITSIFKISSSAKGT